MVSFCLGIGQAGTVVRLQLRGGSRRIDGEGAEEIGVVGADLGAAGEQPVEQPRIAVRDEDVDMVAGDEAAGVLVFHRAAVAHHQRRPRPARDALAARDRAAGDDGVGEQLVVGRAGQFQLDLLQRADALRHDEAEPAGERADGPALDDQRHQHDDEGGVEDGAAVLQPAEQRRDGKQDRDGAAQADPGDEGGFLALESGTG